MLVARRRFLATLAGAAAIPAWTSLARRASAATKMRSDDVIDRTNILYVIIDRPEDADVSYHEPNIRGLGEAVQACDPALAVTALTVGDLGGLDAAAIDDRWRPLAIFGAGSFTEWFMYGVDPSWRSAIDHYMDLIRTTNVPMLAVCGTHQLVALAFNGFGAVAHMTNEGAPVTIAEELASPIPSGKWPNPRPGEEGTYPVVATPAGNDDPLVRATSTSPMASSHHKDMVVDTTGFTLLYRGDDSRAPATDAWGQVKTRCRVQALRLDDPSRILYTTQFHPEMRAFDESTAEDGGFGAAWVSAFLAEARRFWGEGTALAKRPF